MGGDPNAMGGGMDPMGGDPNAMGGGMDPMGGDPNAMGGGMDPMGGGQDPMMGSQDSGFDMGIGISPEENPKKYIEGAVAKVATELRKYQQSQPTPDMPLNKTAVNTIAAATKTNLQDGQENELMTSYADTMRRNGEGSDNNNDGNFDMNQDPMSDGNMGMDPMSNGEDPMMGGDPNAMGGGVDNTSLQESLNSIIREMFKDRLGDIENKPSDTMKPLNKQKHFTRKPFTPPVKK